MKTTIKLSIAALVTALAATVGMAAPADAKPVSATRNIYCC